MPPCSCCLDQMRENAADAPTLHILFAKPHVPNVLLRPFPRIVRQNQNGVITGVFTELSPRLAGGTAQIREELIAWIADEALGGDRQAAEWVLLSCISRVFVDTSRFYVAPSDTTHIPQASPHAISSPLITRRIAVPSTTPCATNLTVCRRVSPNIICSTQPAAPVVP